MNDQLPNEALIGIHILRWGTRALLVALLPLYLLLLGSAIMRPAVEGRAEDVRTLVRDTLADFWAVLKDPGEIDLSLP